MLTTWKQPNVAGFSHLLASWNTDIGEDKHLKNISISKLVSENINCYSFLIYKKLQKKLLWLVDKSKLYLKQNSMDNSSDNLPLFPGNAHFTPHTLGWLQNSNTLGLFRNSHTLGPFHSHTKAVYNALHTVPNNSWLFEI